MHANPCLSRLARASRYDASSMTATSDSIRKNNSLARAQPNFVEGSFAHGLTITKACSSMSGEQSTTHLISMIRSLGLLCHEVATTSPLFSSFERLSTLESVNIEPSAVSTSLQHATTDWTSVFFRDRSRPTHRNGGCRFYRRRHEREKEDESRVVVGCLADPKPG